MKNDISMENDTFIAEESVTRLRATICELDQLIEVEKDEATLTELQQLKGKITSLLNNLTAGQV